ncbi:MAG TPA: hypothetical protein VD968_05220 [Pyrinomonadaceae bacterium]|nr:hypothetical protein [Pyrinomonadaceae bacterium]
MRSLVKFCGAAAAALVLALAPAPAREARARAVTPGQVVISEFRFRGPAGSCDEFVELYNNSVERVVVQSTDGSAGWTIASLDAVGPGEPTVYNDAIMIPNGTVIPPHGHYLATCVQLDEANTNRYSLGAYAGPDKKYTLEFNDATGIALFTTQNFSNFNASTRLDAVGFPGADPLFREGAGLAPAEGITVDVEHSFVRALSGGSPKDTGDNASDFVLVAPDPRLIANALAVLGAPGPESTLSPRQHNADIHVELLNPSQPATSSPNRVRNTTPVENGRQGTVSLQRRVTNLTGKPLTRLRFRVVDITTQNSPVVYSQQADVRVLSSTGVVTRTDGSTVVTVRGLTLEQPPNQPKGGGLNSTLNLPVKGLPHGASVDVQFLLGVQQGGSFNFAVQVEALP